MENSFQTQASSIKVEEIEVERVKKEQVHQEYQVSLDKLIKNSKNIYQQLPQQLILASVFCQFSCKNHPLSFQTIPQFLEGVFDYDRASDKFKFEIDVYTFYNVKDEKKKLESAIRLCLHGRGYHRYNKVWIKCSRKGQYSYFDLQLWKNMPFTHSINNQDFISLQEFKNALLNYDQ